VGGGSSNSRQQRVRVHPSSVNHPDYGSARGSSSSGKKNGDDPGAGGKRFLV
jgi:hypothetical protein